ncbi:hypothetical protein D3C80_1851650 [compost metagenome]
MQAINCTWSVDHRVLRVNAVTLVQSEASISKADLDRALKRSEAAYYAYLKMPLEASTTPLTMRPEPSRRFSVAPMMDWTGVSQKPRFTSPPC